MVETSHLIDKLYNLNIQNFDAQIKLCMQPL